MGVVLEAEGFDVIFARDGAEALAEVSHDPPPSLILLDLMMPNVNGQAFLRRLRADARRAHTPVIVISGDRRAQDATVGLDVRVHLTKPVELHTLLDVVRTALR